MKWLKDLLSSSFNAIIFSIFLVLMVWIGLLIWFPLGASCYGRESIRSFQLRDYKGGLLSLAFALLLFALTIIVTEDVFAEKGFSGGAILLTFIMLAVLLMRDYRNPYKRKRYYG